MRQADLIPRIDDCVADPLRISFLVIMDEGLLDCSLFVSFGRMRRTIKSAQLLRRRDFLAAATATGLGAVAGPVASASETSVSAQPASTHGQTDKKKPVVGVYYYPWYRAPDATALLKGGAAGGWMRKTLRGRLEPKQFPRRGVYDSRDAETIADHIAQGDRGGVEFWAVSWWGPGSSTDTVFRNHILAHPDARKLKYAVLYESTGRLGSLNKPRYTRLLDDFRYLAEHYFKCPYYLKIAGRPVVFLYLTREYFRNRGLDTLHRLREELPQVYLVGDDVFSDGYRAKYARLWDAVTAYDVYGQSMQDDGATRRALARLKRNYADAREVANSVGTGFVPAVSPGFNDKAVRAGHVGRARYFTDVPDSREGDVFRAMLCDVALPNLDPITGNMLMVTSFNEWYEDTQIEATTGTAPATSTHDSASGRVDTEGDLYADYGYL